MRSWLGSVRVRITLLATVALAAALALASVLLVRAVRESVQDRIRNDGERAVGAFRDRIEAGARPEDVPVPPGAPPLLEVRGPDGRVLNPAPGAGPPRRPIEEGGDRIVFTEEVDSPDGPVTIVAASPLDDVRRSVDSLVAVLWVGIPALVVGVGALVWFLVGRALRPVDAIRAEVDEISHGTLHVRVSVPESHDEVARLAGTMNGMLDRLQDASTRQRAFVSDASHELRSPVATIRATMEVALRHPEETDWPAVAHDVLAEDRRMEQTIIDLLDLARVDEGGEGVPDVHVDLDEIVFEEVARTTGTPTVSTDRVSAGRVRGSRAQLTRVVRNLVDNAVRHAGASVAVALVAEGDRVELTVDDDGPGIAPDDRERVFERFTRLDEGRARDAGGVGLGLAMVRAIVERHGGSVAAGASPLGGARFVVALPAYTSSSV